MKILIASDIHGDAVACGKLLDVFRAEQADRLLLLGDILYHGPRNPLPVGYEPKRVVELLSAVKDRIVCVRGNCDAEVDQMVLPFPIMDETATLEIDGRTWFMAHGHRKGANPTEGDLPPLPHGSVILSGHTHLPVLKEDEVGNLYLNSGSISLPKGGYVASYAIYDEKSFQIKSFDGEILAKFP